MTQSSANADSVAHLPGLPAARAGAPPGSRRWLILAIVGLAQLVGVLDATIVNIALPSARRDLGFTTAGRCARARVPAATYLASHLSPAMLVHGRPERTCPPRLDRPCSRTPQRQRVADRSPQARRGQAAPPAGRRDAA